MIRTHVSAKAPPLLATILPRDQEYEPTYKPTGLWWEVDGDWRRWCRGEMPHWTEAGHLYRVDLDPACRILTIDTPAALVDFNRAHVVNRVAPDPFARAGGRPGATITYPIGIDWRALADDYDGIEIAPYQWTHRLSMTWYYGWDCASGCLWRPRRTKLVYLGTVAEAERVSA